MMPPMYRRLLSALFALAVAGTASAQSLPTPPGPWWRTDSVKKELGLTNDQSAKIDQIWKLALPEAQQDKQRLDQLEGRLSHMIEGDRSEIDIGMMIDRVENLRASMN